jgi:CO dehydrogenase/acetyl-CoA synthase alpha subunit
MEVDMKNYGRMTESEQTDIIENIGQNKDDMCFENAEDFGNWLDKVVEKVNEKKANRICS